MGKDLGGEREERGRKARGGGGYLYLINNSEDTVRSREKFALGWLKFGIANEKVITLSCVGLIVALR